VKSDDFEYLRALLHKQSGLVVNPEKVYLLESRLTPLARRLGMDGLDDLVTKVRSTNDKTLITEITEAMTTNESFFFRDKTPFDNLKNIVLPYLHKTRADRKRIRIWCAAASSGQEPYSIALSFKEEAAKWAGWNIEIVATDICNKVLNKAREGEYSQFEVQRGLPVMLMMKYFEQRGDVWKISDEIRNMVTFKYLNLLHPFAGMGVFDVIFCRNVLIYFDQDTKKTVLQSMRSTLSSDGTMFLGTAETVLGISDLYKPVKGMRGMYVPADIQAEPLAAYTPKV